MAETQQHPEEIGNMTTNCSNGLLNNGPSQLVEETDTGQAPVGPDPTQNQGIPTEHRYVFYVHVKPGETFTIRQGDQVQTITGPASVPIYSNTPNPPIIPVQGGQYVQQVIQDSDGTHRIIFTPPGPGGQLPPHMAPQMYPHPGGAMYPHMMPPSGGGMPPHMYPQMVGPGDGSGVPPHLHPHMYAYPQPAPPQCNSPELNHNSVYGHEPQQRPPIHRTRPRDDRTDRQRDRLQRKLRDRQKENLNTPMNCNHIPHKSPSTSPLTTENGISRSNGRSKRYNGIENDIGDDPEVKRRRECLSSIQPPVTSNIQTRSVTVRWSPPFLESSDEESGQDEPIDPLPLLYELLLMEKVRDGKWRTIYSGAEMEFVIADLKPATEYQLSVCAIWEDIRGSLSKSISFRTLNCAPAIPAPPKLGQRSKNSISVKWNAPCDNGSKILSYTLQCDMGEKDSNFVEVFKGTQKLYRLTKLQPSMPYTFRLAATNEIGTSEFSPTASYYTAGSVPQQPSPPQLVEAAVRSLTLAWEKAADDITSFTLEMEDVTNRYGFQPIFCGDEISYTCNSLVRKTLYKFRLCAINDQGNSPWSEAISFITVADKPGAPSKPTLKGKVHSNHFKVTWDRPKDDGGTEITVYILEINDGHIFHKIEWEVLFYNAVTCSVVQKFKTGLNCLNVLLHGSVSTLGGTVWKNAGSPFSDYFYVTTGAGPPDAPLEPSCICKSPHIVIVSWYTPCGNGAEITEYRLEWATTEGTFTHHYIGPLLSHEVKGLQPATYYYFRVQAVNSAGPGQFSAVATCVTSPSSPGAVTHLELLAHTANSLRVQWKEPNNYGSKITSYNVDIGDKQPLTVASNVTERLIEGLVPDTKYRIRVQAVNSIGVGHYSPSLKVYTLPLPPNPPKLECVLHGHQSLKLKWGENSKSIDAKLLNYTLQMEDRKGRFNIVYSGSSLTHKVSKLSELTEYKFRIFATNEAGNGPMSEIFSTSTSKAPPPVPKAAKVKNITEDSCEIVWQSIEPMQGDPILYLLQYQRTKDREYKQAYRGAGTSTKLDVLHPNMEYRVRVCAIRQSQDGMGDLIGAYSTGTVFHTPSDEPVREEVTKEDKVVKVERKPLTDEQWAAIIVVGFAICAILIALLVAQFMA
ncbi:fibronectin type-III domain-containing protein 3A-like [Saccoglossus kowalevskii]|uniref:Fibronectin type-III domain-containing protein 3a-like n=1 Tax=Saccoglossus kowalevskii TaxID=10224 RepID=A0ABM0GRS3_SACKO|nr:PREDICTED: fibronectin type-III domain-containing protein 3a-like [Saccoglossus kowalevskii]